MCLNFFAQFGKSTQRVLTISFVLLPREIFVEYIVYQDFCRRILALGEGMSLTGHTDPACGATRFYDQL